MKRTLATTLTVAGVLGTGGIAMASVWDGPAGPSLASGATSTLPTLPTSTTLPVDRSATATLTDYLVGDAGVVRVEVSNGVARVVSATPNPGWTARIDDRTGEIEVEFVNGTTRLEFEGSLVAGQFVPTVDVYGPTTSSVPTPTVATLPSTTGSAVLPATPGTTPDSSAPGASVPGDSVPDASSTTSPSGGHGSDDDEYDDSDDRYEDESDDDDHDSDDDDHDSDDDSDDDHGSDEGDDD